MRTPRRLGLSVLVLLLGSLSGVHEARGQSGAAYLAARPVPGERAMRPEGSRPASPLASGVLWDNGPFVNSPGTGAGGADESMLQSVSLGMVVLGWAASIPFGYQLADDFTIPGPSGWWIDSATFFGFEIGSGTDSTFTQHTLRIWNGPPNVGGSVIVWGDDTTDRLWYTTWSGAYRVDETTSGDTTYPIMANTVAVGTFLTPGAYWLEWKAAGSLVAGPYDPPITINGQATTGDALQLDESGPTYSAVVDFGSGTPQGFPFVIRGRRGPCSMPALAIPDNNPAGVTDDLVLGAGPGIIDLNLHLSVTHTWVGDLIATLNHVDTGSSVTGLDRPGVPATTFGCSENDIEATLNDEAASPVENECAAAVPTIFGSFTPNNSKSLFDLETITGTWRLGISDNAGADIGTLDAWCLDVTLPSFADVPPGSFGDSHIETIYGFGVTNGCDVGPPLIYCPSLDVTRAQMAIFLKRGIHGLYAVPPPATGTVFADVAIGDFAADWIEWLYAEGITLGCDAGPPLLFCPNGNVTRAQMALFLVRAVFGPGFVPPVATGTIFADVAIGDFAADYIEYIYGLGITLGCDAGPPLLYCPNDFVARDQMGVFLVRAFDLPLP